MFSNRTSAPMRLSLEDLTVLVAEWQQRAVDGDRTTRSIAQSLDAVLQIRLADANAQWHTIRLQRVRTCQRRLRAAAQRCWSGMNVPLLARWTRGNPVTLVSQN